MEQEAHNKILTVTQAAKIKNVTRQGILWAIRNNRLLAYKEGERWRIFLSDLREYDKKRFSQYHFCHNGKPIFSEEKGLYSAAKVSEMLCIPRQKIYHAIRSGTLKAVRTRASYVIHSKDMLNYKNKYLKKELTKKVKTA